MPLLVPSQLRLLQVSTTTVTLAWDLPAELPPLTVNGTVDPNIEALVPTAFVPESYTLHYEAIGAVQDGDVEGISIYDKTVTVAGLETNTPYSFQIQAKAPGQAAACRPPASYSAAHAGVRGCQAASCLEPWGPTARRRLRWTLQRTWSASIPAADMSIAIPATDMWIASFDLRATSLTSVVIRPGRRGGAADPSRPRVGRVASLAPLYAIAMRSPLLT